jgi:DeoR/GlpR family transcriptional regulator of sugar metabolism/DNA-binding LacI/PurR family transcriptional regulator
MNSKTLLRLERIKKNINKSGFVSVDQLSKDFSLSSVTIRRYLDLLAKQKAIIRTRGGAIALQQGAGQETLLAIQPSPRDEASENIDPSEADVVLTFSVNPSNRDFIPPAVFHQEIPLISESTAVPGCISVITINNYESGFGLGEQIGEFAKENWETPPRLLLLAFHFPNTQERSRGFVDGVRSICPNSKVVESLNPFSQYQPAYDMVYDALSVYSDINVIFAINDYYAVGAVNACQDLDIDPSTIIIAPFDLDGDQIKDLLHSSPYIHIGLARFPEVIGTTLAEASIRAFNKEDLPDVIHTPYTTLTKESLSKYYKRGPEGWDFLLNAFTQDFELPLITPDTYSNLPGKVGFISQPEYAELTWVHPLDKTCKKHLSSLGVSVHPIDTELGRKKELDFRYQQISKEAIKTIKPTDILLLDSGKSCLHLAELLHDIERITVITNSFQIIENLKDNPKINLVSIGGTFDVESQCFIGPTAIEMLEKIRPDLYFISADSVSIDFGLSDEDQSTISIKQAMIRAARKVILISDHTAFEQESYQQICPINAIDTIYTFDAIQVSTKLELRKRGIQLNLLESKFRIQ